MTVPRSALWKSIADVLRSEIAGGQYRPGDKLPTEAAMSARFGVNRHTVRHALADMAASGTVHARRGAGVFVASVPTDYPIGRRVRFQQNVLASGRTPSRQILRLETRASNAREAEILELAIGDAVHVIEGLSLADAVPMAMFRSIFPALRFADLPQTLIRLQSITAALAEAGVADYTRASTRLTAKVADALLARHLRIAEGAPVLRSVAVNVDATGRPVEFGTTWFAGERVTLTMSQA
jgi:GntR family transcriptional regulator, phosphonate transport system regulatory protein